MRFFVILIFMFFIPWCSYAQVTEPITSNTEQQLESITENNEDLETEDDSYLQQMVMFIKNPIELNYADVAELNQLRVLTPIQIQNFILYRNLVGKLVNLYELQAVPGMNRKSAEAVKQYL